ncbi:hypothetical protein ACSBR2_036050 [Camellia fascicularis]
MERREREKGGWKPILSGRGKQFSRSNEDGRPGLFTVFVDNLPWSMSPKGFHALFTKFGVVRDVFIPNKARKATKSRFGFVRYDSQVAAAMAVQTANGVWCDDKELKVKVTAFGKDDSVKLLRKNLVVINTEGRNEKRPKPPSSRIPALGFVGQKSNAEALLDDPAKGRDNRVVYANEVGNGWLYDSLVVKLKCFQAFPEFHKAVLENGSKDIAVKEGRCRMAVVSFKSADHLKENQVLLHDCLKDWCESVSLWGQNDYIEQERGVWLSCYGVPLNLEQRHFYEARKVMGGGTSD